MKLSLTLIALLMTLTVQANDKSMEECTQWVEDNLATFAICYPHALVKNDDFYRYDVYQCKPVNGLITCEVHQAFPSSGCIQEIYMSSGCHFNKGAKIIQDEREDF